MENRSNACDQLEHSLATAKRLVLGALAVVVAGLVVFYPFYRDNKERNELRQRDIGSAVAYGNRALEAGDLLGSLPFYAEALRLRHEARAPETDDRFRLGAVLAQCPKLTHFWAEEAMRLWMPDLVRMISTPDPR